jgi:hypothetical protein
MWAVITVDFIQLLFHRAMVGIIPGSIGLHVIRDLTIILIRSIILTRYTIIHPITDTEIAEIIRRETGIAGSQSVVVASPPVAVPAHLERRIKGEIQTQE